MKIYTALKIPLRAFYSRDLYREAAFDWKGTGFGYLFLLLAVCMIPLMVKYHSMVSDFIQTDVAKIVAQIPQITFNDGVASVDVLEPYSINNPDTQKVIIIIDTTGKINTLKDTPAVLLVTKTQAIFKKSENETRIYDYKKLGDYTLTQEEINRWLEIARKYGAVVFYPFAVIGAFIFRIIQILIYAALGNLMASWCKSKIPYDALIRLAVVAVTPCIIIAIFLELLGITLPYAGLWFFLLAMIYLFMGVRESAKQLSHLVA